MKARIGRLVGWLQATRAVRTWDRYAGAGGPLLAQGLSYQSVFAAFAAIWVTFAVAGLVVGAQDALFEAVIQTIAAAVPGLIDVGDGGAIDPSLLRSASILGWTGAIAAVGLVWTAIGWFDAARTGVGAMFGVLRRGTNAILVKLADLGLAIAFGIAVVISAAVSVLSTSLLGTGLSLLGVDADDPGAVLTTRIAAALLTVAFDFAVLLGLYRVLAPRAPAWRALAIGSLLAAVGVVALQLAGGALLGGASSNPLLASFAVIVGLLIWFNLVCQVLLLGAAWIAEEPDDRLSGA